MYDEEEVYIEGPQIPSGVSESRIVALEYTIRAAPSLTEQMTPKDMMALAEDIHTFLTTPDFETNGVAVDYH